MLVWLELELQVKQHKRTSAYLVRVITVESRMKEGREVAGGEEAGGVLVLVVLCCVLRKFKSRRNLAPSYLSYGYSFTCIFLRIFF